VEKREGEREKLTMRETRETRDPGLTVTRAFAHVERRNSEQPTYSLNYFSVYRELHIQMRYTVINVALRHRIFL